MTTENTDGTEVFRKAQQATQSVYFVSSVFVFILTTDFRDLTDANHERKRAYLLNLCYLWSK